MPSYYIMDLDKTWPRPWRRICPQRTEIAACNWLTEDELSVYSREYERTGFQGGLQWYRCSTEGLDDAELELFSGRTIDVPSIFIAGKSDWGTYAASRQLRANATERLHAHARLPYVDGAGHWVQQEQAERVSEILVDFLARGAGVRP